MRFKILFSFALFALTTSTWAGWESVITQLAVQATPYSPFAPEKYFLPLPILPAHSEGYAEYGQAFQKFCHLGFIQLKDSAQSGNKYFVFTTYYPGQNNEEIKRAFKQIMQFYSISEVSNITPSLRNAAALHAYFQLKEICARWNFSSTRQLALEIAKNQKFLSAENPLFNQDYQDHMQNLLTLLRNVIEVLAPFAEKYNQARLMPKAQN